MPLRGVLSGSIALLMASPSSQSSNLTPPHTQCADPVAKATSRDAVKERLAQRGHAELVMSEYSKPFGAFEFLARAAIVLFCGHSEGLHEPEDIWASLSEAPIGKDAPEVPIKMPPTALRDPNLDTADVVHNQKCWQRMDTLAVVMFEIVSAILSHQASVDFECPQAWPLAVLLKLEVDLVAGVEEIYAGSMWLEKGLIEDLLQIRNELPTSPGGRWKGDAVWPAPGDLRGWLLILADMAQERVDALFARMRAITSGLNGSTAEPVVNPTLLERELAHTWLGLDRTPVLNRVATLGIGRELPLAFELLETPERPGNSCVWRTAAMRYLEAQSSSSNAPMRLFWGRMADVYRKVFEYRLADLGPGPERILFWQGAALVERNFSFAWQHCAPAAMLAVLLRAQRWIARMSQSLFWGGPHSVSHRLEQRGLNLLGLYERLRRRWHEYDPYMLDAWAGVLVMAERRVKDQLNAWISVNTLPDGTAENVPPILDVSRSLGAHMCHSTVGAGILTTVVGRPVAAATLVTAGRRLNRGHSNTGGKLALLFMVYNRLHFPKLWRRFFADASAEQLRILVHASDISHQPSLGKLRKRGSPQPPDGVGANVPDDAQEGEFLGNFVVDWHPSNWFNVSLVVFGLIRTALRDPSVQKALILSQDTVPLVTFPQVHQWALADRDHSWLCMDHEYTRAEPWQLLSRRHMLALVSNRRSIVNLMRGSGLCDAEEMALHALLLLGERKRIRDRCVVFTQWVLPKYFAVGRPAPLGRPPPLRGDDQTLGACGHPTTFERLHIQGARRLLHSAGPSRSWFARKFAPGAVVEQQGGSQPLEQFLLTEIFGVKSSSARENASSTSRQKSGTKRLGGGATSAVRGVQLEQLLTPEDWNRRLALGLGVGLGGGGGLRDTTYG
eukprot:gnl/TRDRNA2_/TRDRNA2_151932_c0_seq2.p1 gnl/TRDRNA2_/TRDRNA2_151932_c0~~gnl/TRDRNA2_/TRDRNA2_151932_c0_seq2.p1  ORF type:complete len:900 (-),score=113.69 gnl/TRDRNA2_/TRDRNA2_151932_c0_seq2:65-2764(-)